jgi:TonB family protein
VVRHVLEREPGRLLVAAGFALGLHAAALGLLTRQSPALPPAPPQPAGEVVETEIAPEPLAIGPLPPPRPGRVIETPGAAEERAPEVETDRIAERNADTEVETRRGTRSREPGQRAAAQRAARAAAAPAPTAVALQPGAGLAVPVPDAGVAGHVSDGGTTSATAAAEPGGVPHGITLGIGEHAEDEPIDVPLGDETRLRANVSSYAGFINVVRDRVRRVWRVREVYQQADPLQRYRGDALVTEVEVRVAADGTVSSARVLKGSGMEEVDEEAAAALRRAGPYPPPFGIADPHGGLTFQITFTLDLSLLRFMIAARQALVERWHPSRAFRVGGDRERITVFRVLLSRDGVVTQVNPVASAGLEFLDTKALAAIKPGDRLPAPPDFFPTVTGGLVPVFVEFRHRVGAPSDVRVRRRYRPGVER